MLIGLSYAFHRQPFLRLRMPTSSATCMQPSFACLCLPAVPRCKLYKCHDVLMMCLLLAINCIYPEKVKRFAPRAALTFYVGFVFRIIWYSPMWRRRSGHEHMHGSRRPLFVMGDSPGKGCDVRERQEHERFPHKCLQSHGKSHNPEIIKTSTHRTTQQ